MQGLCLKTYNSDLLQNWINTEWIDGVNGISEVTAIDVTDGKLTMDALNLQQKVYNMLNRIELLLQGLIIVVDFSQIMKR